MHPPNFPNQEESINKNSTKSRALKRGSNNTISLGHVLVYEFCAKWGSCGNSRWLDRQANHWASFAATKRCPRCALITAGVLAGNRCCVSACRNVCREHPHVVTLIRYKYDSIQFSFLCPVNRVVCCSCIHSVHFFVMWTVWCVVFAFTVFTSLSCLVCCFCVHGVNFLVLWTMGFYANSSHGLVGDCNTGFIIHKTITMRVLSCTR